MRKVLLIIRLLVEATFGLICIRLLLLPEVWRGTFLLQFILGYVGMPRRYHASADFRLDHVITLGGLLAVPILLLIGALCFKDVLKLLRRLRVSHHES
jgi:hypothetical protein